MKARLIIRIRRSFHPIHLIQGLVVNHQIVRKKRKGKDMATNQNPLTESSKPTNDLADVSRPPAEELSEEQLRRIAGGLTGSDGGVGEAVNPNEDGRVDV
jgi:hypothetical protein